MQLAVARAVARLGVLGFAATLGVGVARLPSSPSPSEPPVPAALPARLDPAGLAVDAIPLVADAEEKLSSTDAAAHEEGAQELIAAIEADWPDDHRRAFLVRVAPHALRSAVEHCVPPSVTVGQAILESGWGRSALARRHQNLFGVKAGASASAVTLPTVEHGQDGAADVRARFRTYDDWAESLAHHDQLLASDPRYAAARPHWDHWPLFLATVAPTYASDPEYVDHISALVRVYRLDAWDELVTRLAARRATCG